MSEATFDLNFGRFKTLSKTEKDEIMQGRSAGNTNKATKMWLDCFREYLAEKGLKPLDEITTEELPNILSDFYTEVKKKEKSPPKKKKKSKRPLKEVNCDTEELDSQNSVYQEEEEYKNSSLKCMRAALNRYFKETKGLNIITNENFIQANEMFRGVTKKGRREGRGSSDHKNPINDDDMKKLSEYFETKMRGPPNGRHLQELILFNIIYFMGRRGRENLRQMSKKTFKISCDADGRRYIHQVISEHDKNHTELDTNQGNEARIYEQKGTNI